MKDYYKNTRLPSIRLGGSAGGKNVWLEFITKTPSRLTLRQTFFSLPLLNLDSIWEVKKNFVLGDRKELNCAHLNLYLDGIFSVRCDKGLALFTLAPAHEE